MTYYYIALNSRSHAFLLERRLQSAGFKCEIAFIPREIMYDLCNMGVRMEEQEALRAMSLILNSGLPGCRIYKETATQLCYVYSEITF
jgi:hypothetical protein